MACPCGIAYSDCPAISCLKASVDLLARKEAAVIRASEKDVTLSPATTEAQHNFKMCSLILKLIPE